MDSPERTSLSLASRLLPVLAVFKEDLRQSLRHWALLSWAVVGLVVTIVWFVVGDRPVINLRTANASEPGRLPVARLTQVAADLAGRDAAAAAKRVAVPAGETAEIVLAQYNPGVNGRGNQAWQPVPAAQTPAYSQGYQYPSGYPAPNPNAIPPATAAPAAATAAPAPTYDTNQYQYPASSYPAQPNPYPYPQTAALGRTGQYDGSSTSGYRALGGIPGSLSGPSAADFVATLLRVQWFLCASFVIALGTSAIAGEAGIAADAILCRGVSRWEYFVGKLAARSAAVFAVYLALTIPAIALCLIRLYNDLSFVGLLQTLGLVAGLLASITALSVAASAWSSSSLVVFGVVWVATYGIGIALAVMQVPTLNPIELTDAFPDLLRGQQPYLAPHRLPGYLALTAVAITAASLVGFSRKDV